MSEPIPQSLIEDYFRQSDMGGAFDAVYRNARDHGGRVPWDDRHPASMLVEWVERHALKGHGKRALVVGCGLGDDAEYIASLGFAVTAFDISPTAIELCLARWAKSSVEYIVGDVTNLTSEWHHQFDFVLESRTLQAMTWQHTAPAIENIAACVKPMGDLLVLCLGRNPEDSKRGIPWALSREELALFIENGLTEIEFEDLLAAPRRFRVHYQKVAAS